MDNFATPYTLDLILAWVETTIIRDKDITSNLNVVQHGYDARSGKSHEVNWSDVYEHAAPALRSFGLLTGDNPTMEEKRTAVGKYRHIR